MKQKDTAARLRKIADALWAIAKDELGDGSGEFGREARTLKSLSTSVHDVASSLGG